VDFGLPFGSEPGYRRPAVIVQADAFNRSRISTVLLVPLTRALEWAKAPVSQVTVSDRRRDDNVDEPPIDACPGCGSSIGPWLPPRPSTEAKSE